MPSHRIFIERMLMYQEIRLKKTNTAAESPHIRRQTAPSLSDMKETKNPPHTVDMPKRSGLSMNDMRIHYHSGKNLSKKQEDNIRVNAPSAQVVQGRFIGEGTDILQTYATKYPETTYSKLFQVLDHHPTEIILVQQRGISKYDHNTRALYLNPSIFQQLEAARENEKSGQETISSLLSNICHELSHAYDFNGDGTNPPKETFTDGEMTDETFISTELRAWAREAISIMEINKHYKLAYNDSCQDLISGWETFTPDMLDNLLNSQSKNSIASRLVRYLIRRISPSEKRDIQDWMNDRGRKERYREQIMHLQKSVLQKKY